MKIGMILERDFPTTPPDIRVEKEMRCLLQGGHEVELLSLRITSILEEDRFLARIPVFRIPIPMLRIREWDPASVERHFHSDLSPWVQAVEAFISNRRVDALHVHDLPLGWVSACAASRRGIPVVLDLHEVYPDLVRFMRPDGAGAWSPGEWVSELEKECLGLADRIIVTVEESRQRLVRMGVPEGKITVVMNTEAIESMRPSTPVRPPLPRLEGKCVVTYVGAFGEVRGLDRLIRAIRSISAENPEVHLLLVGGGYNESDLAALVRDLRMEERVTITGWVPFAEVPHLIGMSHICVVPHVKSPFTDTTVPHKLFQYMLMAKPVVVSDAAPLVRITRECECGMDYPSEDVQSLARCLELLVKDADRRRRLGENGRRAAVGRYHWGKDGENLLSVYAHLR
jgi:glycosyltransferase involved in cell wall biosynthesis